MENPEDKNLNENKNLNLEKKETELTSDQNKDTSFNVKDNKIENPVDIENKIVEIKETIDKAYNTDRNLIESEKIKIEKETVIEMLKKNGLEDPEAKKLLNDYLDQQQELRDENEDIDASQIFNIRHCIDMTDFYLAIGDKDGAVENIDEALEQAEHYRLDDLILEIKNKRKNI